jgi:hypothetical protein
MVSSYQNAKIYKIVNDIDQLIYVGSTIKSLNIRFTEHKCHAKLHPERKIYKHFMKLGIDHFEIKLIKNYPCSGRTALDIEEERYKLLLNAQLNTRRAHQTAEQLNEYQNDWHAQYYQNNRAKKNERIFCKICGKTYTRQNKLQHCKSKRHQKCVQFNKSKISTNEKYEKYVKFDKNKTGIKL